MWKNISGLVNKRKQNWGVFENAKTPNLWKQSINKVHPKAAPYTEYKNLINDVLYINVKDSIWIGELDSYKSEIKKNINTERARPVKDIKFTLS